MLKRFLLVLLLVPGVALATPVVLLLGDSVSAGYGIPANLAWPALLEKRLLRAGLDYRVVNASISGETTTGGRARIESLLAQHRPAVLVLELGGNDGLRGTPTRTILDNLEYMILAARRRHAKVVLVAMQLPPNYGAPYTRAFNDLFGELASRHGLPRSPFLFAGFADRRDLFQPDGIHPTAAAQPLMLENVWPALDSLLRRR